MRKIIYISVLLFSLFSAAQAQQKVIYEDTSLLQKDEKIDAPVEDIVAETDSTEVAPVVQPAEEVIDTALYQNNLQFPSDSIKNWKNLKEYAYTKYLDSLLKNIKKEVAEPPPPPRSGIFNSILNSGFVSFLLWAVVISFIAFVIYRLFLAEGVFQRKSKSHKQGGAEVEEEIITKESDFDALIRIALQTGKFRQAVRYQYLRTLHLLAGKNFIELAPDKTNYQYVSEITNRNHQQHFAALTLNYEYVWYGEFDIDKNIYQKIETNFTSLNQKL